eukprot:403331635
MKRPKSMADLRLNFNSNVQNGGTSMQPSSHNLNQQFFAQIHSGGGPGISTISTNRQLLKSQGFPLIQDPTSAKAQLFGRIIMGAKTNIQKQHLDVKNYLEREKRKQEENEKMEIKLKKIQDEEKEKEKERKALIAKKEEMRQMKRENAKRIEREREKEFERERKKMSQQVYEFELKERQRVAERRQRALEKSEREKQKQKEIEEKRIRMEEEEQEKLLSKLESLEKVHQEREGKLKEIVNIKKSHAKEYTDHILERLELLKIIDVVKKIEVENKYLEKVDKIEKVRTDKQKLDNEQLELLRHQHEKRFGRTLQNKQMMNTETKRKVKDLNSKFRTSTDNLVQREENMYRSQMDREKQDEAKRDKIQRNLEKEKRKLEWKKLKILAKEKMNEERVQFLKFEENTIKKSLAELTIQQQLERERIRKTMSRVRSMGGGIGTSTLIPGVLVDFRNIKTKEYIQYAVPDIDISDIFKPKQVEKKEEDLL